MCGISGIFDITGERAIDRNLLQRMNDRIGHRGPDGDGMHVEPGVGLAHRRLAIIDVSGGHQPIYNEDESVAVVFNGEIYNFQELTPELERLGHRFRTRSDTEVIVHAWESWGEDCVRRFGGMFAFALWDRNRRCLFLARDRLGKKPLYYSCLPDGRMVFASELKALLVHPGLPRGIDPRAVEEYFAFGYVPDPRTILNGVHKLPPGATLLIEHGQAIPAPRQYWDLRFEPRANGSEADVCAELVSRLRSAVKSRLISEVPLGAFLSGGVDSSAVVSQMADFIPEGVQTCSIGFDEKAFDESSYAARIAERYHTRHWVRQVDVDDFALLEQLANVYDEPFADSSAIPTYRVCQLARERVTVALSGDGGDEAFGGYRRYKWHVYEDRVRRLLPLSVRRPLFGALGRMYPKLDWAPRFLRAKSTLQALARDSVEGYLHSVSILSDEMRAELLSPGFQRELQGYRAIEVFRRHAQAQEFRDPLSLAEYLDFKTYLPGDILVKVDRASMAHSLEVRVPMLDYEFVEWTATLDPELKLNGSSSKYILKKAMEPYLPDDLLHRPKMGFAVPIARWFRGPLRELLQADLLQGPLAQCGFFNMDYVRRLVDEHQSGRREHSAPLWSLLMFSRFLSQVLGPA